MGCAQQVTERGRDIEPGPLLENTGLLWQVTQAGGLPHSLARPSLKLPFGGAKSPFSLGAGSTE